MLAGRIIAVYPITALFQRTALATNRITQHILGTSNTTLIVGPNEPNQIDETIDERTDVDGV